ncbi:MAG: type IV pilus secretin PilQ [Proteobacteria bacterium]|nr:type IV pilus secretin PilQ [Pseudomonadota bacterium]
MGTMIKSAMLGLLMVLALPVAQAETQNKITALSVSEAGSGTTIIKVELAEPLANPPAGFAINVPPRIALDFPNTENALGKSLQDFSVGDLRSANIVQAGSRTRLVVNLNQMLAYDTRVDGNAVLITLHAKTAELPVAGERFADARLTTQKHTLNAVDFRRGKNGEGRIQVDLSDSGVGIDIHRQGTRLIVDFLKTNLPGKLQRKLDVVDFATPVQLVDTFAQGDNIRMVIEPKGMWEHVAYQTDSKFIVEIKPVVEDPNKLVKGGQPGYAGEKLTLNFQDISVREALNVIADFTELNMVISDSVTGNLTLRLKDVPWDQALDIILQSRGLAMRKNGNVIQVAPIGELAASEKSDLTARQDISELEELRTESFQLGYTTATAAASLLNGISAGAGAIPVAAAPGAAGGSPRILSKRGSAMADVRTNTLFVKDIPSRMEDVRSLLKQIDVPVRQVMIEARFVSAGDSFARSLGGKLGFTGPAVGPNAGFAIGGNTPTATRAAVTGITNVNLPAAPAGTGGLLLSLFNPSATKVLSLELDASETDGITKNIASPKVVTADKTKASIKSGVEIPYTLAGTVGSPPTTAFKTAALSLDVTPHITPDNNINMMLVASQDTVGALYAGVPSINSKSVTTEVLVENGGTVVVGGVFTQDVADTVNKVPLLGDIPVFGWMFKNKVKTDAKNELLIFITPKIMQNSMNLR